MKRRAIFAVCGLALAFSGRAAEFPTVWTSFQWKGNIEAQFADMAAHGVECAVMIGGAYRGLAIDRNLFAFSAGPQDIIVEPPVYSVGQPYASGGKRSGHYFGGKVPLRAEVIVPLKLFDGAQHLKILPAEMTLAGADAKPENDTVTVAMKGTPEVEKRRLVRLLFDLTPYKDALLDKIGLAVYWANDTESDAWKKGNGQMSVFSPHTRAAAVETVEFRLNRWKKANGGTFPSDVIVGLRFGDECFNVTGWLDCPAAKLAVLRPYSMRALVCDREGWSVKNPADALLGEFVRAWSIDHGRAYDVFEVPPYESAGAKAKRDAELKKYDLVVSTIPYEGAKVIGVDTVGKTYTRAQLNAYRRECREKMVGPF